MVQIHLYASTMFENFTEALTEAFESVAEALKDLLSSFAEMAAAVLPRERQVYDFSTEGYGEAAGLPERTTSSIIEFHSAPLSSS